MRVRIVLCDRSTGLYYRGENHWARNGYDALTFANILDAEAYCREHGLHGMQLIQQSGHFFRQPEASCGPRGESHADRPGHAELSRV